MRPVPNRNVTLRCACPVLAVAAMAGTPAVDAAELWNRAAAVDTSQWKCKYCPTESGVHGRVDAGLGYVGDNQYRFGNYTGLDSGGSYPLLGGQVEYHGEGAGYWRANGSRLPLDSRQAQIEGGRQGTYRLVIDYQDIPRRYTDQAQTPYSGVGGDDLVLPGNWVKGGSTGAMVRLNSSLHPMTLGTDRRRIGVGLEFTPQSRWTYSADFRHETKTGTRLSSGSVLATTEVLPEPVDYRTDEIDLGLGYKGEDWRLNMGYLGSFFRNGYQRLRWDNPFSDTAGQANEGQMALAPDNQFHQLTLSGRYDFSAGTRATAKLALGRMTQNQDFLPYTVNPFVGAGSLPRSSLDGVVRTTTVDARLVSAVSPAFTVQADLRYRDRDDQTPVSAYAFVGTDSYLAGVRSNRTYDRRDTRLGLQGRYRIASGTHLSAGVKYQRKQRPGQEVDQTRETTMWAQATDRWHHNTDLRLRLAYANRDAPDYHALGSGATADNPLMVKFNMAARDQLRVEGRVHTMPNQRMDLGVDVSYCDNAYHDTVIGVTASRDTRVGLDANFIASEKLSFHAFASREVHKNQQSGSQNFSVPDWFATSEDVVDSTGAGLKWAPPFGDLSLGLDYVRSEATGSITLDNLTGYPDLKSVLTSVKAHAEYRFSDALSTEVAYVFERLDSDDWAVDGLAVDTVPSLLASGDLNNSYSGRFVAAYVRYRF